MTAPTVCVLSAWFGGGGDWPHQPAPIPDQGPGVECILVSDVVGLDVDGWTVRTWRPELDPRMAAKTVKCRPEQWTDAEIVVWADARRRPTEGFTAWAVGQLGDGVLAAPRHPERRTISQEAATGSRERRPRFHGVDLRAQTAHYLRSGHPDNYGLWWTTIVARRPAETAEFGRRWLDEQRRWSTFDQLSFPHVARQTVRLPATLDWAGPDPNCG